MQQSPHRGLKKSTLKVDNKAPIFTKDSIKIGTSSLVQPGVHIVERSVPDPFAFAAISRKTPRPDPRAFLQSRGGFGGAATSLRRSGSFTDSMMVSSIITGPPIGMESTYTVDGPVSRGNTSRNSSPRGRSPVKKDIFSASQTHNSPLQHDNALRGRALGESDRRPMVRTLSAPATSNNMNRSFSFSQVLLPAVSPLQPQASISSDVSFKNSLAIFGTGIMGFGINTSPQGSPSSRGSTSSTGRGLSPVSRSGGSPNRSPSPPPRGASTSPRRNPKNTDFRGFHERNLLPCSLEHNRQGAAVPKLLWHNGIDTVDLRRWMPIFVEGIRELDYPFSHIALTGLKELLFYAGPRGMVVPLLPYVMPYIKLALNTRHQQVLLRAMDSLRFLVLCDSSDITYRGSVGRALVPYYRSILPIFNIFLLQQRNLGDGIDYAQRHETCLGDRILELLNLFEVYGGKDAFINIKYLVPTYTPYMGDGGSGGSVPFPVTSANSVPRYSPPFGR